MSNVTATIDGMTVTVPAGTNVIEAAKLVVVVRQFDKRKVQSDAGGGSAGRN